MDRIKREIYLLQRVNGITKGLKSYSSTKAGGVVTLEYLITGESLTQADYIWTSIKDLLNQTLMGNSLKHYRSHVYSTKKGQISHIYHTAPGKDTLRIDVTPELLRITLSYKYHGKD